MTTVEETQETTLTNAANLFSRLVHFVQRSTCTPGKSLVERHYYLEFTAMYVHFKGTSLITH